MKIAIEGCAHGELEKIYDLIASIQEKENVRVDLLICCGDFQSTRNQEDLQCMAVPRKHMDMCSFYKYYSGEKVAPIPTIFIGGNHEASNYLQELPYGGWVAPNIYYLGYAGVVEVNGVRIAGISGIYKGHDYLKGRFEFAPYNESTKRSVYHIRQIDVFRLRQLTPTVDIILSHDWPVGVTDYGNKTQLLRFKPAFQEDIENNKLGSPPCMELLKQLQPTHWFSAHLHCKFSALVPHEGGRHTKFLALDKCLPQRRFLQVLDIDAPHPSDNGTLQLKYDLEWLTILKLTNHLINARGSNGYMPGEGGDERFQFTPTDEEKAKVLATFANDLTIPSNFQRIAEAYDPSTAPDLDCVEQPAAFVNPQTTDFCDKLYIDDPLRLAMLLTGHTLNTSSFIDASRSSATGEEINIDDVVEKSVERAPLASFLPRPKWCHDSSSEPSALDDSTLSTSNTSLLSLATPKKNNSSLSDSVGVDQLNLSSPVQETVQEEATEEDAEKTPELLASEVEAADTSECDNPPVKRFKRRNQSIYSQNDD